LNNRPAGGCRQEKKQEGCRKDEQGMKVKRSVENDPIEAISPKHAAHCDVCEEGWPRHWLCGQPDGSSILCTLGSDGPNPPGEWGEGVASLQDFVMGSHGHSENELCCS
jgi:hypothetical protein